MAIANRAKNTANPLIEINPEATDFPVMTSLPIGVVVVIALRGGMIDFLAMINLPIVVAVVVAIALPVGMTDFPVMINLPIVVAVVVAIALRAGMTDFPVTINLPIVVVAMIVLRVEMTDFPVMTSLPIVVAIAPIPKTDLAPITNPMTNFVTKNPAPQTAIWS
jgi:hypothetical protein